MTHVPLHNRRHVYGTSPSLTSDPRAVECPHCSALNFPDQICHCQVAKQAKPMPKAKLKKRVAQAMAATIEDLTADTAHFIANDGVLDSEIDPDLDHDDVLEIIDMARDIIRRRDVLAKEALSR